MQLRGMLNMSADTNQSPTGEDSCHAVLSAVSALRTDNNNIICVCLAFSWAICLDIHNCLHERYCGTNLDI